MKDMKNLNPYKAMSIKHNPTRNGHCSGCTDPQSEGTHQMGTFEHPDEAQNVLIVNDSIRPLSAWRVDGPTPHKWNYANSNDAQQQADQFNAAYAAGQAAQWIPVEERLPEPMVNVLVYQQYDTDAFIASIRTSKYGKQSKPYWYAQVPDAGSVEGDGYWDGEVDETFAKITHWMPLPAPPTKL